MKQVFVYIGIKKCGCVVAACVDEPKYAKDNASAIGNMVLNGMTVERVSVESGRARIKACECDKPFETPSLFDQVSA